MNLNFKRVAHIDHDTCIGCNLCYIACEDGAHQCIDLLDPETTGIGYGPGRMLGKAVPVVREADCVGCNLCSLVCPVDQCVSMVEIPTNSQPMTWSQYQVLLAKGDIQPIPPHP